MTPPASISFAAVPQPICDVTLHDGRKRSSINAVDPDRYNRQLLHNIHIMLTVNDHVACQEMQQNNASISPTEGIVFGLDTAADTMPAFAM